jgi:hypothetical protein
MSFYEELADLNEEGLKASFEKIIDEPNSGDPLMPPSGEFEALLQLGRFASEHFYQLIKDSEEQAKNPPPGMTLNEVKFARSKGRLEGMGAGFHFAIDTFISYAEAERLREQTGIE